MPVQTAIVCDRTLVCSYNWAKNSSSDARKRASHQASHPASCARSHFFRNRGYRRRWAYAEFREMPAVLHASMTLPCWRKAARNGLRQAKTLGDRGCDLVFAFMHFFLRQDARLWLVHSQGRRLHRLGDKMRSRKLRAKNKLDCLVRGSCDRHVTLVCAGLPFAL
jgi:hypothetical protein